MSRRWSALAAQAFDTTPPVREAHLRLRRVRAAASRRSQGRVGPLHLGNPRGVQVDKLAVDPANLVGGPVFRHKQRNLMSLIEIIEIHETLPSS